MQRLISYFLQGLVFLVPLGLTMWVVAGVFLAVDGWVRGEAKILFPGAGVLAMLIVVTLVGALSSLLFTRPLFVLFERLISRVPVVKIVYGAVKDLMSAFVGPERRFDRPVVVALDPAAHVRALGFVTRESLDPYGIPDGVAVYFPQAYNFAGQVVIVPRSAVIAVTAPASEVMTFIVSGGVSGK
jgi:uncharacterized membrane protein